MSCQCKVPCNTKRYKCYKIRCHRDESECGNLSDLAIRTKITLVDRPIRKQARADTVGNRV